MFLESSRVGERDSADQAGWADLRESSDEKLLLSDGSFAISASGASFTATQIPTSSLLCGRLRRAATSKCPRFLRNCLPYGVRHRHREQPLCARRRCWK